MERSTAARCNDLNEADDDRETREILVDGRREEVTEASGARREDRCERLVYARGGEAADASQHKHTTNKSKVDTLHTVWRETTEAISTVRIV